MGLSLVPADDPEGDLRAEGSYTVFNDFRHLSTQNWVRKNAGWLPMFVPWSETMTHFQPGSGWVSSGGSVALNSLAYACTAAGSTVPETSSTVSRKLPALLLPGRTNDSPI